MLYAGTTASRADGRSGTLSSLWTKRRTPRALQPPGSGRSSLAEVPSKTPLFSTYRRGENRITGSLLAVLQRIDPTHVARLLGEGSGESELPFVSFINQAAAAEGTVPDAEISASFHYLFEVKTTTNAVKPKQLAGHLQHLRPEAAHQRLFVLTPDADAPSAIAETGDPRIAWLSFRSLDRALLDLLADDTEMVSEQERFLLHELHALLEHDGLLERRDTVVVAARVAYPDYLETHSYVCQPGRPFRQGLMRMGFYAHGAIQRELPAILYREDHVLFSGEDAIERQSSSEPSRVAVGSVIAALLAMGRRMSGEAYQVFVLSAPDASDTLLLDTPIVNTKVDKNGKPWAWTMSQSYVDSNSLRQVSTTSELDQLQP